MLRGTVARLHNASVQYTLSEPAMFSTTSRRHESTYLYTITAVDYRV